MKIINVDKILLFFFYIYFLNNNNLIFLLIIINKYYLVQIEEYISFIKIDDQNKHF